MNGAASSNPIHLPPKASSLVSFNRTFVRRFQMEPITYRRIGNGTGTRKRSHGFAGSCRGFRLNSKRFSVSKLRAKLMCMLRMLNRWRRSYSRTLRSLKKGRSKPSAGELVAEFPRCVDRGECRLRSFRRSNSFYAEAIADCLDFIKSKRSSVSIGGAPSQPTRIEFRDDRSAPA